MKGVNVGVAPVTYGTGDRPPRGNYGRARSDYTCPQDWAKYSTADHDTYRLLYTRQLQQLPPAQLHPVLRQVLSPDDIFVPQLRFS